MDEQNPEVDITTRPYIGDAVGVASVSTAQPDTRNTRPSNRHLFADATGRGPIPRTRARAAHRQPPKTTEEGAESPVEKLGGEHVPPRGYLDVDWKVVTTLTHQLELVDDTTVRSRGSFDVASASALPETEYEKAGLEQIRKIVRRHAEWLAVNLGTDHEWGDLTRTHYVQAVFDQAFRYGRLHQYLREDGIEEISVTAHDRVYVVRTDGRREKRPPIADNAAELENLIAEIATYRGRTFVRPGGDLDLDIGGARLSATSKEISEEPNLTIRLHNLVNISLDDLVRYGTLNSEMADVLTKLTRWNARILVAGFPSAGKTTFLRALMSSVEPDEKIVTIETERELYLHKMPERHNEVQALQYIPGQYAGGDSNAGYPLERAFYIALRSGAERILFAEIRGPEGPIAMKAMNAGKGSMSTIHANSADDAIQRFADVLMSEQNLSDDTVPLRQLLRNLDFIVYLESIKQPDGSKRRMVTEIAEVARADSGQPIANAIYTLNFASGRYETGKLSEHRRRAYERRGFNLEGIR
ncbi:MAG: ATPase, T2SS/T4P/T4SS family [Microbacterium sp.]